MNKALKIAITIIEGVIFVGGVAKDEYQWCYMALMMLIISVLEEILSELKENK